MSLHPLLTVILCVRFKCESFLCNGKELLRCEIVALLLLESLKCFTEALQAHEAWHKTQYKYLKITDV